MWGNRSWGHPGSVSSRQAAHPGQVHLALALYMWLFGDGASGLGVLTHQAQGAKP